jgi:hypothetical protein
MHITNEKKKKSNGLKKTREKKLKKIYVYKKRPEKFVKLKKNRSVLQGDQKKSN